MATVPDLFRPSLARTWWGQTTVTYSYVYPGHVPSYYAPGQLGAAELRDELGSPETNIAEFPTYLYQPLRLAMDAWESVSNLTIRMAVSDPNAPGVPAVGQIAIGVIPFVTEHGSTPGVSSDETAAAAFGWGGAPLTPDPPAVQGLSHGADLWISTRDPVNQANMGAGEVGRWTLLHELGHSLGLKHSGGDYSHPTGPLTGTGYDNIRYTAMSYFRLKSPGGADVNVAIGNPVPNAPMILDIAAIQWLCREPPIARWDDGVIT